MKKNKKKSYAGRTTVPNFFGDVFGNKEHFLHLMLPKLNLFIENGRLELCLFDIVDVFDPNIAF